MKPEEIFIRLLKEHFEGGNPCGCPTSETLLTAREKGLDVSVFLHEEWTMDCDICRKLLGVDIIVFRCPCYSLGFEEVARRSKKLIQSLDEPKSTEEVGE